MKYLPYVVIAALILFIVFRPVRVEHVPGEIIRDTIVTNRIDTVRDTVPIPVYESVVDLFLCRVIRFGIQCICLLHRKSTKTAFIRLMCQDTEPSWIV